MNDLNGKQADISLRGVLFEFTRNWGFSLVMFLELIIGVIISNWAISMVVALEGGIEDESSTLAFYLWFITYSLILITSATELIVNMQKNRRYNAVTFALGKTRKSIVTGEALKSVIMLLAAFAIGIPISPVVAKALDLQKVNYGLGCLAVVIVWLPVNAVKLWIYAKQDYLKQFRGVKRDE